MSGAPAGFDYFLGRKYAVQDAEAAARSREADAQSQVALGSLGSQNALRYAQAQGITGALGSENALRMAQAGSANADALYKGALGQQVTQSTPFENQLRAAQSYAEQQRGATLGPLASSAMDQNRANITEALSRANANNAQAAAARFNTTDPANNDEIGNIFDQNYRMRNFGASTAGSPGQGQPGWFEGVTNGLNTVGKTLTGTDQSNGGLTDSRVGSAGGATDVRAPAKGKAPPAKGKGAQPAPQVPQMPLVHPHGAINLHAVMAHAQAALAPQAGPPAAPPMPGRVQAAGGAADVYYPVPVPPLPAGPAPGQTITSGTWGTPTPNQDLRRQLGLGIRAAGGASDVNMQGGGHVPGRGAPNVDSVKAVLAPHEAVLNAGAAAHLGRGTISVLNALGAAKMAQAGMPPATPPTAHGVPRGAPKGPPKAQPKTKVAAGGRA